jgi:hypothetical protein
MQRNTIMSKTQRTSIKLTPEQNEQFNQAHLARIGAMEASEMMAQNLQRLSAEAQEKVQKCYEEASAAYKLDLKRENWQYDQQAGVLRLTGLRFNA